MKEKEDEKEKEKMPSTSALTPPSDKVITEVTERLKAIGFTLSCNKIYNNYSVSTSMRFFNIDDLSTLIKVLESSDANFVTELDFTSRRINGNIKNFVEQLKDTNITKLDLTNNCIGDAGATALADAIKQEGNKITDLYLNNNNIGDAGTKALADAIKQEGSKVTVLHLNINHIGDEGKKALDGLKDIIGEVVYDLQSSPLTFSTASTTTTSVRTTSSPKKPSVDEKLLKQLITSDSMLKLLSSKPQKAYEKLSTKYEFDTGMFIKLITYAEISSNGKFAFKDSKYLLDLVKNGSFNLDDPMLLAYAVRLSNEELALSVTKELITKGAKITGNILYHSYYNPPLTKFLLLLIEELAIPISQDKTAGIDAVIKKVQAKFSILKSKKDKDNVEMTLKLLEAAKIGGDDLNIKLDKICPTDFSQNVSSTSSTTTTSISTTSSFEKSFDNSSSSSTSVSYTTTAAVSATSSSGDDTVTISSSSSGSTSSSDYSILSSITEGIPESADSAIPLTGESATVDAA
jgi:hypothetical protein